MILGFLIIPQASKIVKLSGSYYHQIEDGTNASTMLWKSDDIKSIDNLYLLKSLVSDYIDMGFENNESFYKTILHECSTLMVKRTEGLDINVRKMIFLDCRNLLLKYYKKEYRLNRMEEMFNDSIMNKKFVRWNLLSNYF